MADEKKQNIFTITLSDGTQITNLIADCNTFLSDTPITAQDFEGKLQRIKISCTDPENYNDKWHILGEHEAVTLVGISYGEDDETNRKYRPHIIGKYLFGFGMPSEAELREMRINARIAYLEMLEGVDDE